jgi:hypothetical protein
LFWWKYSTFVAQKFALLSLWKKKYHKEKETREKSYLKWEWNQRKFLHIKGNERKTSSINDGKIHILKFQRHFRYSTCSLTRCKIILSLLSIYYIYIYNIFWFFFLSKPKTNERTDNNQREYEMFDLEYRARRISIFVGV